MLKKTLWLLLLFAALQSKAQNGKDSLLTELPDYAELFSELDDFLDSLTTPRNFTLVSTGFSSNFFSYAGSNGAAATTRRQFTLTPSIGFFSKEGPGLSVVGSFTQNDNSFRLYQWAATASYDWLQSRKIIGGLSYTRFFTKDSLQFYTSPLQNELYAYTALRGGWLRPMLSASYGWGSRTAVEERTKYIKALRKRNTNAPVSTTTVVTEESVSDFSVTASLRHDFYWLNLLQDNDFIRFTPQLSLISGTQRFGFNQTSTMYAAQKGKSLAVLNNSENVSLSDRTNFMLQSVALYLKGEYSFGKFFLQPQIALDYYLPAGSNAFSTAYSLNTGFIF